MRLRNYLRAVLLLVIGSLLIVIGTGPASAQSAGRSVAWQRFDVDLDLQSSGALLVTETQTIQFNGTFQEGYRLVPLDRTSALNHSGTGTQIDARTVQFDLGQLPSGNRRGSPGPVPARLDTRRTACMAGRGRPCRGTGRAPGHS